MPAPVVAVVQARMGSTRLPGKVLAHVLGRPLLAHMLQRVARARRVDRVVVATTTRPLDDGIAELARELGAGVFRGDEEDVLGRFHGAARETGAEAVVRLTADCPLMAPEVVDRVVDAFAADPGADLVTNAPPSGRTYPDGMDVEVLPRKALERAHREATRAEDREHVTRWFHASGARVSVVHLDPPCGELRLSVDDADDLARIAAVLEALAPENPAFSLEDVLEFLARHGTAALPGR